MNAMEGRWCGLRTSLKGVLSFAFLWWRLFAVIVIMAGLEGAVLWLRGFRYEPGSSFDRVWVGDVSMDATGRRAAIRVSFKRKSMKESISSEVVLVDLHHRELIGLDVGHLRPQSVAIAPGADSVAVASADGCIYAVFAVRRISTNPVAPRERMLARSTGQHLSRLVFSPDGSRLAGISTDSIRVWKWPSGTLLNERPHGGGTARALAFTADSQDLVSPGAAGGLCRWNIASGETIEEIASTESGVFDTVLWSDVRLVGIARSGSSTGIAVLRVESDEELWEAPSSVPVIAFDPQRRRIATLVSDRGIGSIDVRDAETGKRLCRLSQSDGGTGLTFSADGLLCCWDLKGTMHAWNIDQQRIEWSLSLHDWVRNTIRF